MNRQKLVSQIRRYVPYNEQEEADKALILNWIEKNDDAFLRDNVVAHMTASAWVWLSQSSSFPSSRRKTDLTPLGVGYPAPSKERSAAD